MLNKMAADYTGKQQKAHYFLLNKQASKHFSLGSIKRGVVCCATRVMKAKVNNTGRTFGNGSRSMPLFVKSRDKRLNAITSITAVPNVDATEPHIQGCGIEKFSRNRGLLMYRRILKRWWVVLDSNQRPID